MMRPPAAALALADRLCRPQRIGIFGHRGVGKTTLLTMIYREAVAGRLPELRLAAADARTAEYLSDKVLQLEAGQPLPGTLAETDLRFHLYHGETRLELLMKDYQGEHVELGRNEAIHTFLRDCDAVWLCLDLNTLPSPGERLRRQQEIEQLVEDYLAGEPRRTMDRPLGLVLTKVDILGPLPGSAEELAQHHFGMTRHTLSAHCNHSGLFTVSSLGARWSTTGELAPLHLAEPLAWLAGALQAQDESRLERLFALADRHVGLLERCVACFAHRYPDAPATQTFRGRLQTLRQRRRRRLCMTGAAAAAVLTGSLWTYDALGYHQAVAYESAHAGRPDTVLENWQRFRAWHPTRHLFAADAGEQRLRELAQAARQHQRDHRLAELRRQAADPDADPEKLWQAFLEFKADYPELPVAGDLDRLRAAVQARRDQEQTRRARRAYEDLARAGQRSADLSGLVVLTDRFLRDHPGSPLEPDVRKLRNAALLRLDEQDIQAARDYSARQPLNFQTRRELYQRYLDRHPGGSTFNAEARAAIDAIDDTWDRHDFRRLRDQFVAHPGDIPELVSQCRRYLAVHPTGKFTAAARDLLRWTERVTAPGDYRVVLRSGQFEESVARWFTRGPKLSVEIEVAGVRYGPSNIVKYRYDPDWDFEFPRRIRWKLGDPVVIRVTEHTWRDRVVAEFASGGDPLAIRMLAQQNHQGTRWISFESDFAMPALPRIE